MVGGIVDRGNYTKEYTSRTMISNLSSGERGSLSNVSQRSLLP